MNKEAFIDRAERLVTAAVNDKATLWATMLVLGMALDCAESALREAGLVDDLAKVIRIRKCETDEARAAYNLATTYGPMLRVELVDRLTEPR